MEQALDNLDSWQAKDSSKAHEPLPNISWDALQRKALHHYEKSLSADTRSEDTVAHRGFAKEAAIRLCDHPKMEATAHNLLARIALDEGFYALAEQHLNIALNRDPKSPGAWYSFGHLKLATNMYDEALYCFSKSLELSPGSSRTATSIAYTLAQKGETVKAFQAYRSLVKIHPKDKHILAKLSEITRQIKADYYQSDLEVDVISWLTLENINHQNLAPLAMSLLSHKYKISEPDAIIDIQDLASDKLLNLALEKLYFTDPSLEEFLITVRKQILLNCIASEYKDQNLLELATRFSIQALFNEHVYTYDKEEQDILTIITDLIKSTFSISMSSPSDFAHLYVLYAMYEPLVELEGIEKFKVERLKVWPDYIQYLLNLAIIKPLNEIKKIGSIPTLGNIRDDISINVKQQYEENPYPRWLHLNYHTPTNYGRTLESELRNFKSPEFFNMGTIKVLIAGCGTGQHALNVAKHFRNVDVLAVDLSQRSLIYAQTMAERYQVKNIKFLNADILELDQLKESFHIIECSGVLHHMKDPDRGLAMLKAKLLPKGLIKLGLYSHQARTVVREIRGLIEKYDLPSNKTSIRTIRKAILQKKLPYDFTGILESQDFFSMSGCRDLLFHEQECQYRPTDIETMINHEKLKFLGFILPNSVKNSYLTCYPEDKALTNLDNWQTFEENNPTTFSGMFQFYLQG